MENDENTDSIEQIGYAIQLLQGMSTESKTQLNQPNLPISEVDRIIGAVFKVVPGWMALLADIQSVRRSETMPAREQELKQNAPNQVPRPFELKSVAVLLNTILTQLEAYRQLVGQVAECPRTAALENLLTKLAEQGSDSLQGLRSFLATSAAGGQTTSDETRGSAVARPRVQRHEVLDPVVPMKSQLQYSCSLCRKSYTAKQNLEGHMNSVHLKVKPFACSVCNQRFSIRAAHNRHQRGHFWMFKCDMCNHRYKQKAHLVQHKARRH